MNTIKNVHSPAGMVMHKKWCAAFTMENLKVRYRNWKVRGTAKAYFTLSKAMQDDPSYAHSWMCNIAMPIYDGAKGKLTIHEANALASDLMRHLFGVTNTNPQ